MDSLKAEDPWGIPTPRWELLSSVLDYCPTRNWEVRNESKKNGAGLPDDHGDKSLQKLI